MPRAQASAEEHTRRATESSLLPTELRARRQRLGLSQAQLAGQLGVAANTVARWERGELRASHPRSLLRRLARLERTAAMSSQGPLDERGRSEGLGPQAPRHNLPAELSSFVGRQRELADLRRIFAATRVLTLTGTGGVGKSRLALRLASAATSDFPHGVWLVDLAPLSSVALVPQAVATAVGVHEQSGRPIVDSLVARLRSRRLLLVLDNCEHLLQPCAEFANVLLRACPDVRLLTTSREPLGLEGETVWRVPSLTLPPSAPSARLPDLEASEAIQLFVDRARAAVPGFILDADNAFTVGGLCSRLDGMPLAIELAAARLRVLTLDQLAPRLDAALDLLVGGSRTGLARHQTLRATLDWSYGLLTAREQQLFDRVSVFAGGWTLEAAEAVCGGNGLEGSEVLDTLSRLVDKSLVVVVRHGSEGRFRLLETVRQFGREHLLANRDLHRWNDRHAAHFLALAEATEPDSWGPRFRDWWTRLDVEQDNMRAALRWLIDSSQVEAAQRLGGSLERFWKTANHCREGQAWLTEVLALPGAGATLARARVLMGAGELAENLYEFDTAEQLLREALEVCRDLRNDAALAFALFLLAQLNWWRGAYSEGRTLAEEGAALSHSSGLRTQEALCLQTLDHIAYLQEDYVTARSLAERALALATGDGYARGIAVELLTLGRISYRLADLTAARAHLEASLLKFRESAFPFGVIVCLNGLGLIATDQADFARAHACFTDALSTALEIGQRHSATLVLEGFAQLAEAERRPRTALRLAAAAAAQRDAGGFPLSPVDRSQLEPHLQRARRTLGAARAAAAWSEGRSLSIVDAVAEALAGRARATPNRSTPALTQREAEVAAEVARGRSNHQIAAALVVSERTVDTHLERIYLKLNLHSRAELATWVTEHRMATGLTLRPPGRTGVGVVPNHEE